MMSTRSGRVRPSIVDTSPPRTRKGISPTRSPARTRKSSPPARSPSRKSPSRKSPSRKTTSKYPARKSPSRATLKEPERSVQKSPTKGPANKSNVDLKFQDLQVRIDSLRGRSVRNDYSVKDISVFSEYSATEKFNGIDSQDKKDFGIRKRIPIEEVAPRRSSRLIDVVESIPDIRRSLSKSISKSISKSVSHSIDTVSDSEEEAYKPKTVTRKLATPLRESVSKLMLTSSKWEFGGRIGSAILTLILPVVMFSVLIACSNKCSINKLAQLEPYKSVSVWFSPAALLVVISQFFVQAVFALVPIFGTKADRMDESNDKYCFNAFFSSIVSASLLFLMDYLDILNSNTLLHDYLKLAIMSYLFAWIISLVVYIKSRKSENKELNPYGNTGYFLYDFAVGCEIHPRFNKLDLKIWLSRICNITTVILCILILKHGIQLKVKPDEAWNITNYKDYTEKVQLKPTILVFSTMQMVYALNFIMREYKTTSTFSWHSEGVGYLQIVSSLLYPYYYTSISKYVVDTDLTLPTNVLIGAAIIFSVGLFIMLYSNNIKYEFRKNPLHTSLLHLESMPTFHGKKLLVSGLWGLVRHPNYTGDILMHVVLAIPGIWTNNVLAAAPALTTVLVLLHRAWRDHDRCKRRYGSAWQRYCKKVPSIFLPKIL